MKAYRVFCACLSVLMLLPLSVAAQDEDLNEIAPVTVVGTRQGELEAIPGASTIVPKSQIEQSAPMSGEDVLRLVPGVTVMGEDGLGLRLNVGLRGLDPERSRNVLVLEDGIPVAAAPYVSPGMYYATPIYMVQSIDVLKGSSSILYGPQTIGGVINYKTLDYPTKTTANLHASGGSYGAFRATALLGAVTGGHAYMLQASHQRYGGPRGLDMDATSVLGKMRVWLDATSWFDIKLQVYDEFSRASYLGLTTAQYEDDPFANHAIYDRFNVRRYAAMVRHNMLFNEGYDLKMLLQTTVYAHILGRDWQRQDFDRRDAGDDDGDGVDSRGRDYERVITGKNTIGPGDNDGSTIFFRNSSGNRNRRFEIAGIESRLSLNVNLDDFQNEFIVGMRMHGERVDIKRINGDHGGSPTGVIRDDERLGGVAFASYLLSQTKLFHGDLRITPGLRYEVVEAQRKIYRKRVNGTPTDIYSPETTSNTVWALIPGLGVDYDLLPGVTAFAGVHRGFSPPRAQDAITSDGENLQLEAEYSVNYELGARAIFSDWAYLELAGFILDFSNQVIEPTEASGAVNAEGLVNGGETLHTGFELGSVLDIGRLAELEALDLTLNLNYTFTSTAFGEGWADNIEGNTLPYAPRHTFSSQLALKHTVGLETSVTALYVGEQFTDKENTIAPSSDGLRGVIDGRFVLDARVAYTHKRWGLTAFVWGKNLTNAVYISSRRPQGIRAAGFRQFMGGLEWSAF